MINQYNRSIPLYFYYYIIFNGDGHFGLTEAGKRVHRGCKVTVNRGLTAAAPLPATVKRLTVAST